MPVLHIGDIEITAYAQQLTSPALHIKNADGEIYHIAVMPVGGGIFDASETLVYEENTINTCQSFELPVGIYRVEMRGGTGGKPYACRSGYGTQNFKGDVVSSIFKLNEKTVVYALRGGDGNNGAVINSHQIPGGAASGVDSILVVGNRVIRANGGTGTRCLNWVILTPDNDGGHGDSLAQGGSGGIYPQASMNDGGRAAKYSFVFYSGGGGGAPSGTGGVNVSGLTYLNAGFDATDSGGGNGGDIQNPYNDSETLNYAFGGSGGQNVYFSCGGQNIISYGGGGAGAICIKRDEEDCETYGIWCVSDCFNGGDGGSGSTGTSNDSFIKIYKIG